MDMGCSLKGSTASTIGSWDHFHIYIIYDFSKLSQIWGYVCGGNCWRKRSGQSRCSLRPLTHASVDRAYQAESVGGNSLPSILIAIRCSPNL